MTNFSSLLPTGLPADPALLPTLLDLLPMGVMYYTPVLDATGTLTDLALAYLNPAAQRMTRLPAQPGTTYRQQFPTTDENGAWEFHRRSWLGPAPGQFQFYYDADGFDSYFRVTAQRLGEGLLTLFTDTQDEDRSEVEQALHLKQAREQAARAEAEQQALAVRETMRQLFDQAPVAISMVRGPQLVVELLNEEAAALLGSTQQALLGKPLLETMPTVREQGLAPLFERVLQGEVFTFDELPITFPRAHRGQPDLGYYRVIYQPWRDGAAAIIGMVTIAVEVSEQVLARQQVQRLNAELAASNEALRASNAEYQRTNTALGETQQQLRQRNQELEAARAEAEADRQRLYQVLMRMPANIALLRGPAHVYDLVNAEYERLFPARSALGRPLREVIPELEGQGFYELFDRVYETGEPFYQAEAEAWADYAGTGEQQRRYYRTSFEPIRNPQGQVVEVLNFAVDVTEQVEARQQVEQLNAELESRVQERTRQLSAQQALLGRILGQVPAAVATLEGPEHRFSFFNEQYHQLFHEQAALGRSVAEVNPESATQDLIAVLDQVYHTGEPFVGNELFVELWHADGSSAGHYLNFVYQPLRDPAGQVSGILVFAVEVTASVHARQQNEALHTELLATAQRQVQEREAFYQIFEQTPALVALLRAPSHRYEYVNPAYQALYAGRQLVGLNVVDAIPELQAQGLVPLLDRVYQTGEAHFGQEVPEVRQVAPGQPPRTDYFNFTYQAYREDGQVAGISIFAFDVTEQALAHQQVHTLNEELTATNAELQASNQQLTRTNVELDTFVYTASHDLKAPITNIESITLALRDTLPEAVQQDEMIASLLALLEQTTQRFLLTIGQLTDLSKLQLAHAGPAEPVYLAAVIESVRLDLAPSIVAAEVQLTVVVAPDLLVSFSPANLRSAIYNLLSNAVKYRALDRPARVEVRAFPAGPRVVLEVQDNGLGLNEHQQSRLFGLFQRLHTHVEGTGVGLYTTKRLVENGGGTIAVVSQVDAGTTFTLTFPA